MDDGYAPSTLSASVPKSVFTAVWYSASVAVGSSGVVRLVSFSFVPITTGTWLCLPAVIVSIGASGWNQPSTSGPYGPPAPATWTGTEPFATSVSAGSARRHAMGSGAVSQPTVFATDVPFASAVASGRAAHPPLWMIAAEKSPFASGDATSEHTFWPPADSPKIVTRAGSPPNAFAFVFTHESAATRSRRP